MSASIQRLNVRSMPSHEHRTVLLRRGDANPDRFTSADARYRIARGPRKADFLSVVIREERRMTSADFREEYALRRSLPEHVVAQFFGLRAQLKQCRKFIRKDGIGM
jgi:hypothetical protein